MCSLYSLPNCLTFSSIYSITTFNSHMHTYFYLYMHYYSLITRENFEISSLNLYNKRTILLSMCCIFFNIQIFHIQNRTYKNIPLDQSCQTGNFFKVTLTLLDPSDEFFLTLSLFKNKKLFHPFSIKLFHVFKIFIISHIMVFSTHTCKHFEIPTCIFPQEKGLF